ncbi:ThiF family adenylyltransferase [Thermococcus argininiproducens]|uniref:ThiF family adenylyltransferase n=1 Tax=Thermococcus argininiproducens TaxID=2866384 RepID=A0A9E7MA25_9EURY|nr:ThiF family adenylyltransferase [Thermococcus argininiproducens]USG99923.1 ThiF family adenylyltransferase [Thermococcus argininiproducens]
MLTKHEIERQDREIKLLGVEAQEKLKSAKVAIVGLGGLGCPVAYYLAAAGVGTLLLIDCEKPELSNLDRQILYWEEEVGKDSKVNLAKRKLEHFNSHIKVETSDERLSEENVIEVLKEVDVVVDCVDNFETRYIIDRYCQKAKVPLVHGGVNGLYGEVTTIIPEETQSLEDIFSGVKDTDNEKMPIFGSLAGIVGTIEAAEVVKIITNCGNLLTNKLLIVDLARDSFETIELSKPLHKK